MSDSFSPFDPFDATNFIGGGDGLMMGGEKELADSIAPTLLDSKALGTKWKPLPHQIPPDGDWYGFFLMGGRGSGKTDTCANLMVEHVNGPACLPGPAPHWMVILAPTLGDASTACFMGPSGIRAHDSSAEMLQKTGGLIVRWPNGSQAKLLGTRDRDDIERLRAAGNSCLHKDSLVETEFGPKRIIDIRVGEKVWTRKGLRKVINSGQTGVKPLWKLETNAGRKLLLTGDHPVWTDAGWTEARFLKPHDTLVTWIPDHSLSMPESNGSNEAMGIMEIPMPNQKHYYTDLFGLNTMAQLKIIQECMFITWTKIKSIIQSKILNYSHHRNIIENIQVEMYLSVIDVPLKSCGRDKSIRNILVKNVENPSHLGDLKLQERVTVSSVENGLCLNDKYHLGEKNGGSATFAEMNFGSSQNILPKLAHENVLRITPPKSNEKTEVYDIQVEDVPEFFANGIVVHNCFVWLEEVASFKWLDDAWDQMRFGLRSGPHPRFVASTTPKPRPLLKKINDGKYKTVVVRHATMYDNPYLPDSFKEAIEESYGGTTLGAQELYGKMVDQDENALWTRETIAAQRRIEVPPLKRIVVGVDPSGGAGEQGIVVVGSDVEIRDGKPTKVGWTIADRTVHLKPEGWGRAAIRAAVDFDADCIVVETNFGGDMAVSTLITASEEIGVSIPVRTVHASRGKHPRAEPVSMLAQQGRWYFGGNFDELETQLCTWTADSDYSPDRLDAMVWPAWYLKLVSTLFSASGSFGGSQMSKRVLSGSRRAGLTIVTNQSEVPHEGDQESSG